MENNMNHEKQNFEEEEAKVKATQKNQHYN